VSDRHQDWEHSYRVPDVVVVLPGCPAIDHGTHWQGGPDLLVEIRSPGDASLRKLDFYATVGVREVLIVDPKTRRPYLYRLARKRMAKATPQVIDDEPWLLSQVLPLAFTPGDVKGKPRLLVRRTAGAARTWRV
jgi:Uma2 family endonuclease